MKWIVLITISIFYNDNRVDPKQEKKRKRMILVGEVPSPANPPSGCNFNTRCPRAEKRCSIDPPEWRQISPGHHVACHLVQ